MTSRRGRAVFNRVWPFPRQRSATEPGSRAQPSVRKIVLVTTDSKVSGGLSEGLVASGNDVEACQTIRALRHSVRRCVPDAVLVDWRLAADGAVTIIRYLRGASECSGVTVVALIPKDMADEIDTVLRSGCDDFVSLSTSASLVDARLRLLASKRGVPDSGDDTMIGVLPPESFAEGLRHAVYRARRSHARAFAVFAVGVDALDTVTSVLGFAAAATLLEEVARRFEDAIGSGDLVARCGGDDFVILVSSVPDVTTAMEKAHRIQDLFDQPFEIAGDEVFTNACVGVALWPGPSSSPEDLHRDAATALRRATRCGRRHITVFDQGMREDVVVELRLVNGLKRAVKRAEFCPFFQPIVSIKDGRISGFEALVRWRHPERGLLMPADFIDVAEQTDTIIDMDRMLMEAACRQLRTWQMRFRELKDLTLNVNVSTREFLQPDFVPRIDLILRSTGLYGRSLKIEVTESVLMEYSEHAAEMLEQLRKLAIGICIDDFGTGYSSFNYLRRFEIDVLKIDRSFVSRMTDDDDSAQIVAVVAALARNLGKVTVAEGVETVNEFNRLRELGVDQVQGFYVARPLSAEAAEQLLEDVHDADNHLEKIMKVRLNRI